MKLTSKQIKALKKQLLQAKAEIEHKFTINDHYGLSSSLREMTGELSTSDNHPADIGSELYERGKDIALNENAEKQLESIIIALDNIELGQYALCLTCGKYIPYSRLKAIPTARYCINHAPNNESSQPRPVEEEIMSLVSRKRHTSSRGEDAWEMVENYGNSDSPAMSDNPDTFDYDDMYDADENAGYVEPMESFVATDLFGKQTFFLRNQQYRSYMANQEKDHEAGSNDDPDSH